MIYVWHKERVLACDWNTAMRCSNCFAYDKDEIPATHRWAQIRKGRWASVELEQVPKEFRTSLLLMGVL